MWVCGVVWVGWGRGVMALTQAFACSASFDRTVNQHLGTLKFESFRPADDEVSRKNVCWRTASWERADPVGQRCVLKERRDTTATQGGDTTTSNCAAFRIPLLTARSNT